MPTDAPPIIPMGRDALFAYFDAQGLTYSTVEHAPVFTVAEGADMKAQLPGGHSKNLFLKAKNGALFLVSAKDDTQINLNRLHKALDCDRLSFGSAPLLAETLGVTPGSVTAFALVNDPGRRVRFLLDKALWNCDPINFHPLTNAATTAMPRSDFGRFLAGLDRPLSLLDFSGEGDPALVAD
jgi:Ala-tRNA(Pro) deacylase